MGVTRSALPWLLLPLAACGGPDVLEGPDAGAATDAGPPPCAVTLTAPDPARVRVGGSATLAIGGAGWSELQSSAPEGWRVERGERALTVTVGYALGAGEVRVNAACPEGSVTATATLEVAPARFTAVRRWAPGQDGPLAREYFSMWLDPSAPGRLWVYGGFHYVPRQFTPAHDVWSLALASETWTQHPDGPADALPGGTLALGPDGVGYRYGGLNVGQLTNTNSQTPFKLLTVTTSERGATFEAAPVGPRPRSGDYQASFFFHPGTGRFYSACGVSEAAGVHCELASYDPRTARWSAEVVAGDAPPGRNGHFWAYDPATDRLIIFAGEGAPSTAECAQCRHDTWALDLSVAPPRWTRLAEDGGALGAFGRRNGAFALDTVQHRLLVWGGTPDGATTAPGLFALDLTEGQERWFEVPVEGDAPARTSGAMVFDPASNQALMGFGNGDRGVHADLWRLELGAPGR
jgi:hypothetical protein